MASRSLNRVQLIGNLTRDPELRYTPQGTAVCTFGLATNRQWVTDSGEKKEDAAFHKVVAWSKLAEICSQLLSKGRRVYIEGRLSTRSWTGQDGSARQTTEIVASDMIILDNKSGGDFEVPSDLGQTADVPVSEMAADISAMQTAPDKETEKKKDKELKSEPAQESEEMPF